VLELNGENFKPNLTVWFGDVETCTTFKSSSTLISNIPDVTHFLHNTTPAASNSMCSSSFYVSDSDKCNIINNDDAASMTQPIQVPINLVRSDGIIYHTGLAFTYTPESYNESLE
jgi:hypothetical protein